MAANCCSPAGAGSLWRPWLDLTPSKLMRVWCATGRLAWFLDRFAGAMFHWLLQMEAAEASDLQLLHSRPAEDHNVPTSTDVSKVISKHCLKLTRFDAA